VSDIAGILSAIAQLEGGITPPAGQRAAVVLDSPPLQALTAPAWLNLEDTTDYDEYRAFGVNHGPLVHTVNCYLLVPPTDPTNRLVFRRLWEPVVAGAFEQDTTKLAGTCDGAFLGKAAYVTATYAAQEFLALRFPLRVLAQRA